MRHLKDRVAVITGAASGIGLALATQLGKQGMKLVLADVEGGALAKATDTLRNGGCKAVAVETDVSKLDAVVRLARLSVETFGKVHVLCNNAGVSITGPIWKLSADDWRWVFDVNVWGVIHGIRAFVPDMIAHGEEGHVINTASLASFLGTGEHAPYCSSKAAVLSISQALFSELRAWDTKIGATVLCPGMVDTQIHRSWRNRPQSDRPWSERESSDPEHQRGSASFQARGVPAEAAAKAAIEAMLHGHFYAYAGGLPKDHIRFAMEHAAAATNPPVVTWGPDLRPESARKA